MKRRRVKITGIGPVTPAGIGREAFWKGILEPVSRVRAYEKLAEELGPFVAAAIDRFDAGKYVDRSALPKGAARHTLFALAGAALAIADAGIPIADLRKMPCVVVTGSCVMDFGGMLASIDAVAKKGPREAQPRTIHTTQIGSVPSSITSAFGLNGRTLALSNQCSSGMDAIAFAASLVASGEVEIALCGGTDAPLHRSPMLEMRTAHIITGSTDMAQRQTRPFDLWRNKSAVGEGCAMFVLEPDGNPRPGYSYISGSAFSGDTNNVLCGGLVEAAHLALANAGMRAGDIEVLNAWGPGDREVDRGEAQAMQKVFGDRLSEMVAVSIKGAVGSALGAAPAIQIATAALAQRAGVIPPTVNWQYPDPDCPLNLSNRSRAILHRRTLVNSHGLGAINGCMILDRC